MFESCAVNDHLTKYLPNFIKTSLNLALISLKNELAFVQKSLTFLENLYKLLHEHISNFLPMSLQQSGAFFNCFVSIFLPGCWLVLWLLWIKLANTTIFGKSFGDNSKKYKPSHKTKYFFVSRFSELHCL